MEKISGESEVVTYHPETSKDDVAQRLNHLANEVQRPFWYFAQNVHRYAANPLHEDSLTDRKGEGEEVRPERPKALHLNACMFPGGLPYAFWGVRTAGERMEQLKVFVESINPDIFFLCEFSQTLSGKLFESFQEGYRHFLVNVGANAKGMDASMTVVSREPIVNEPKFFPSKIEAEGEQKSSYRGFFHVETEKVNYVYVHLHPKETDRAKEIRQEQLAEIKKITEDFANGKAWVILGDINIERGSTGHQAMLEMGFCDVIQEQHGNVETCINGLEEGEKRNPESIDGFLVIGGDLQMQTEIHDTYEDPRKALTDHKGISALIG